jgi:hypothetical protein
MNVIAMRLLAIISVLLAACGRDNDTELTPTPIPNEEGVTVRFLVAGSEEYRIRLIDPEDIEIARKLLAGEDAPTIPNGVVVHGSPDVNTGYSWHIDPASVEFADVTMEVCDGLPSDVEQGIITSNRYCPWSAVVVGIEE